MTKKRETKKVQLAQYSLERVKYIIEFLDSGLQEVIFLAVAEAEAEGFLDFAHPTTTRTNMIKVI